MIREDFQITAQGRRLFRPRCYYPLLLSHPLIPDGRDDEL
jgi:hypothetical protein